MQNFVFQGVLLCFLQFTRLFLLKFFNFFLNSSLDNRRGKNFCFALCFNKDKTISMHSDNFGIITKWRYKTELGHILATAWREKDHFLFIF
nr:hypothetical protein [Salmonella sp.]